jgi:hypothetical protein
MYEISHHLHATTSEFYMLLSVLSLLYFYPFLTLSIDVIVQQFTQSVKELDLFVNIYFLFFLSTLTEADITCT